jgi:hypothetical protein
VNNDNNLNRPVRTSDYFVIATGFVLNIASAIDALADDLHQLAVYHSNQKSQEDKVWQKFSQDLETIKENKNVNDIPN